MVIFTGLYEFVPSRYCVGLVALGAVLRTYRVGSMNALCCFVFRYSLQLFGIADWLPLLFICMKTIQILTLSLSLTLIPNYSQAEAVHPEGVVRAFIEALQTGDSKAFKMLADIEAIEANSRTEQSIAKLKKLFTGVDLKALKFEEVVAGKEKEAGKVSLKMIEPIELNFELQHQNAVFRKAKDKETFVGKGDYFLIIAVYPTKAE